MRVKAEVEGRSGDGGGLPISPKAFAVHPILYGLLRLNASTCVLPRTRWA